MNYNAEVDKARKLLQEGNYCLCSVQCGRVTEEVLKDLFKIFLPKAGIQELEVVKKQLAFFKKRAIENLTLGELSNVYEKTNAFHRLAEHFSASKKEVNLIDLRKMVIIRNKAQHGGHKDLEIDTGADAHIVYGSILKLLQCFKLIGLTVPPIPPKRPKEPPKPAKEPPKPPVKPIEGSVYTYKIHGAVAKMIVKNTSYVILEGSTVIKDEKKSCPISALRIKKSLIASGKLVPNPTNDLYVFTEDVGFKSPSAASTVISGTSTNGWLCFGI